MTDTPARLARAAVRLAEASDTPRLDAELLAAHSAGIERETLLLAAPEIPDEFEALVERRAAGEPIAYIVGKRAFWTLELAVGPGVLIPRPDSETLIEESLAHFGKRAPRRIVDLGTGPGTLLLAALDQWPSATGVGVDTSDAALDYARANAKALGMEDRVRFEVRDFASDLAERFDLVLANPPYIAEGDSDLAADVAAYEPREALMAGADGLDAYRGIVPRLGAMIAEGGIALMEIGHRQGAAVRALMESAGLEARIAQDLGGRDRVVAATVASA